LKQYNLTLKLNDFTVLIGKNGVDKSSILHALNFFFKEPNYKSEFRHFVKNDELKVIEIAVGDEINNLPNVSQKYYGERLQYKNLLDIRQRRDFYYVIRPIIRV